MNESSGPTDAEQAQVTDIQARYADSLMKKAHVVGVAVGLCKKAGITINRLCLVVMVDQKLPLSQLAPEDRIPSELEGVPVDVQEMGVFTAF